MLDKKVSRAVDAISAATASEVPWSAVRSSVVDLTGAGTGVLWIKGGVTAIEKLDTSFGSEVEQSYAQHYHALDQWTLRGDARQSALPFCGTDLVSENELRSSEIYTDFFRPLEMFHLLAATVPLGGDAGTLVLGLHRREAASAFDPEACRALSEILPHLRRSLRLRYELCAATGAAQAALAGFDAFDTPSILVTASGRFLHANCAAGSLLRVGRGLVVRNGHCTAAAHADAAAVAALIRAAAAGGAGEMMRLQAAPGEPPLTLLAVQAVKATQSVTVLLLLIEPAARSGRRKADLLRQLYGLTVAEAEVAEAAARGEPAASIAKRRGSSEATVRAQLRAAIEKSGQRNLRALSAHVAALPGGTHPQI